MSTWDKILTEVLDEDLLALVNEAQNIETTKLAVQIQNLRMNQYIINCIVDVESAVNSAADRS